MTNFRFWVLGILCLAALALSVLFFFLPGYLTPLPEPARYQLRDCQGRLALYALQDGQPAAEPLEVYEIYTRLLPETDYLALQQGVAVADEDRLQALLEDYGL